MSPPGGDHNPRRSCLSGQQTPIQSNSLLPFLYSKGRICLASHCPLSKPLKEPLGDSNLSSIPLTSWDSLFSLASDLPKLREGPWTSEAGAQPEGGSRPRAHSSRFQELLPLCLATKLTLKKKKKKEAGGSLEAKGSLLQMGPQ